MQKINVSNVLNKLKSFSDKTDILIYDYNNEQDKIKKWVSTIKETVDSIVNDSFHDLSDNAKEISKSAEETICIPDLVKLLKDDNNVSNKHRISTWLAEVQKDHVKHNRKSRHSLRKFTLAKKSGNRWAISKTRTDKSNSKLSKSTGKLIQDQEKSLSKSNISFTEENHTPKLVTSVSTFQNSTKKSSVSKQNMLKTSEVKADSFDKEDSHFTPVQSSEILAPNTCETPTINNKKPCYDRTHVVKSKKILSGMKNELEYKESTPVVYNEGSTSSDKYVTPESKVDSFHTPNDQAIIDSATSADVPKIPSNRMKRKSSLQLTRDNFKKAKSSKKDSQEVKSVSKVGDNSIKHPRRGKPVNTSAVIQAKTSAISSQQTTVDNEKRILREIQKKEEIISQNTKKIKSLRQQKIEENKKTREMKMEKAMQQRMKIVKEKEERLRSRTLSKQQENVQQKGSAQKKTHAKKVQNKDEETSSGKKLETPTSSKKTSASPTKSVLQQNGSHSTKKAPPKPVRTPAKKPRISPKEQAQENQVSKANQTFSMTTNKITPVQEKDVFAKPTLNSTYVGSPNSKSGKNFATPTAKKTESKAAKTPQNDPSKKLNSYAVTPSESSFVSYDVSEIKSDDDDDEEEEEVNRKPIPSWAAGVQLRNTLLNQHYNSDNIDTDKLFGNYFDTPNLEAIMGVQKKHYFKRTSSAIWLNSPNRSILS